MKRIAIYPGSFDPVTNGHLDIIQRARSMVDRVIVAVAENVHKSGLFSAPERVELLKKVIGDDPRVEVDVFTGLLVDYAARRGAEIIIRGLRAVADFEYEFQLALMNRRLAPELDTIFLMTDERNFYVSSSLVREVAFHGGDISDFVAEPVKIALMKRVRSDQSP